MPTTRKSKDWQQARPTYEPSQKSNAALKRQQSDLTDDQPTVQKVMSGFTGNNSSSAHVDTSQKKPNESQKILPNKAMIMTRDQSHDSSNSDRRKSSLTSGNKTFLQPTPSQQLNQKNKLIERSRANCIKNLQRLIEQRTHINDSSVTIKNQQSQANLNRTSDVKREAVTHSKNSKMNVQSIGPAKNDSLNLTNPKSVQANNHKSPMNHATSCETFNKNQRLISTLNNTAHQRHLHTHRLEQRDIQSCTMGSTESGNVLRSLNLDQNQMQVPLSQYSDLQQPLIIQSTQHDGRPTNMQTTKTKVKNQIGNGLIMNNREMMNSCEQIMHKKQHQANQENIGHKVVNGFFFSEYEDQNRNNYSSRTSSPVTQGFSSTKKSNVLPTSPSALTPSQQKFSLQRAQEQGPNTQNTKQRFIQPLRTMTTKNSKMIDLNKNQNVTKHQQPQATTCQPTPGPCILNTSCLRNTKAAMVSTVNLNFPGSIMSQDKENMNGLELQNRQCKPLLYRPTAVNAKYNVNSLKAHLITNNSTIANINQNNLKKSFSRNQNSIITGPDIQKIVENVAKGNIKKIVEGQRKNLILNQQKSTARFSHESAWSEYCEMGGGHGFGNQLLMDTRMPNEAARGDIDSSPQQLTGMTNSNYKQPSNLQRLDTVSDYRDPPNMQTSTNSWSQMQSVSSDSHNKMNKPIQSLHGQNGLPEYNRIGSPGDMFQHPDQKYGSQFVLQNSNTDNQDQGESTDPTPSLGSQANQLRTLVSRNKQNHILLCHASLQGSLTDIQAAPSIMEVDLTVGSQPALHRMSQRAQSNKNGIPSTPTLSQAMPGMPAIIHSGSGQGMPGVPNVPMITTEMTPSGSQPQLLQRAGSTTLEDEGWKEERVAEVEIEDQQDNLEIEMEEVGASLVKESARISLVKQDEEDDIAQIDKNTTERSCQSPLQSRGNRESCSDNQRSTFRFDMSQRNQETVDPEVKPENQERLLNFNNVLQQEQNQTGGTDASLIREEMADQVNELISTGAIQFQNQQILQPTPIPDEQEAASNQIYTQHFQQTLNIMRNLHLLDPYQEQYHEMENVELPEPTEEQQSKWPDGRVKVVFFDIDETMIHCLDDKDASDMIGEVNLEVMMNQPDEDESDVQEHQSIQIQINLRPGLHECLHDLSKSFQLVSFTAGDPAYADTILDFIDPDKQLFTARLYRHHCVDTQYGLIKDLRIIRNRQLNDLILIDNSALSFALNVNNGIPILPFYCDTMDEELRHLNYYLNCLRDSQVNDVRVHNAEAFGLLRLKDRYGNDAEQDQPQDGIEQIVNETLEDQVHIKLYESMDNQNIEQSGEYLIRGDEDGFGGRHHGVSKEYLQCDPMEMTEDSSNRLLMTHQSTMGHQQQFANNQNQYGVNYHDQPITILNLMGTYQIIEERSNEDEGLTSSHPSPSQKASSKQKEELSIVQQSQNSHPSQINRMSIKSIADSQKQNQQQNLTTSNYQCNLEPSYTGSPCHSSNVNQSQKMVS